MRTRMIFKTIFSLFPFCAMQEFAKQIFSNLSLASFICSGLFVGSVLDRPLDDNNPIWNV